ncbi:hypothetical protein EXS45_01985 [Candidatus Nomurabacteria bacterium]|nr:hypothetical protein [Candidatus Nomurabacteria bacterium]
MYGLDPTKKETTPGTPDTIAISRLSAKDEPASNGKEKDMDQALENLTETDKFSRELFATIAAASQNGMMDQTTIETLSIALADKIKNSLPRKVFLIFEIKTINNDTVQAFKNYNNALNEIYRKYPGVNYTILDVLQKFMIDENNIDASALVKLDPIIKQINNVINAMIKTSVPQSISALHLNVINAQERLVENLSDLKLFETDSIVALGGISKYEENATRLDRDLNNLANAIQQKLNN